MHTKKRVVLIDNYDSFTYNVVYALEKLGAIVNVYKNDEISLKELNNIDFSHLVISPGPSNPDNAGISLEAIYRFYKTKIILGICLGHQCIAKAFGSNVIKDKFPTHGKTSKIYYTDSTLFANLAQGFNAMRYHSLIVDNIKDDLVVIARNEDNIIMALRHRDYSCFGVQFHPESILSDNGILIFKNFLNII